MAGEWSGTGRIDEGSGWRAGRVELAGRHLGFVGNGAPPRWWRVEDVRDEGGGRFALKGGVRLEVADLRLGGLLAAVPRVRAERLWPKALGLAVSLLVIGWVGWRYGLPALADQMARRVPVKYERKIGAAIADAFASPATLSRSDGAQRAVNRMVGQLARGFEGKPPYAFTARLHCTGETNAAAAPGGIILVLDGLVDRLESPDQLAAVLAHEMQHVSLRHWTRAMFRRSALQIGFGLLVGDVTSVAALAATGLTDLGYTREDELEADGEGARLMAQAGFDPAGMTSMFALFARDEKNAARGPSYLRTHPFPSERLAALEGRIGGMRRGTPVEAGQEDWLLLKRACPGDSPGTGK